MADWMLGTTVVLVAIAALLIILDERDSEMTGAKRPTPPPEEWDEVRDRARLRPGKALLKFIGNSIALLLALSAVVVVGASIARAAWFVVRFIWSF